MTPVIGSQEPDTRERQEFRTEERDIVADPVSLDTRLTADRLAWRFDLLLPGDKLATAITVLGYLAPDPVVTLKEVIASLLAPSPVMSEELAK